MNKITLDVVMLTKDNPSEFNLSLKSLPFLPSLFNINVIALDGSIEKSNSNFVKSCLVCSPFDYDYYNLYSMGISGIYPSMNFGLDNLKSDWCIFLNSGDFFAESLPWGTLASKMLLYDIVFGVAKVVDPCSSITWFVPPSSLKNIDAWLRFFEPNHQTFFVRSIVACNYKFDLSSPVGADALWKRTLLKHYSYIFIEKLFVVFSLGGVSSKISLSMLNRKLREPSRRLPEKIAEIFKFIISSMGFNLPLIQKCKSIVVGFLF